MAGNGETILVVEDDSILREALFESLKMLSYNVMVAANGKEALKILHERADEVSLVMSDLVMPEMGGATMIQEIRKMNLAIPVIILSGHPLNNSTVGLQGMNPAGWIVKPPEMDKVSQILYKALNKTKA